MLKVGLEKMDSRCPQPLAIPFWERLPPGMDPPGSPSYAESIASPLGKRRAGLCMDFLAPG